MADITIDSSVNANNEFPGENGTTSFMTIDVSPLILYHFYQDASGDLVYSKSTDGGATWGAAVTVNVDGTVAYCAPSVWFDKWTSGDTGTKIHIAYITLSGTTGVAYRSLDTASDTLSSATQVVSATTGFDNSNITHIVKDRGGYLYIVYSGWTGSAFFGDMYRSVDNGANWTDRATPWESDDNDGPFSQFLPGNMADPHDLWLAFGDISASEVSLKTYDDSADSWAETSINSSITLNTDIRQTSASVRHSDGHMILAIATNVDNANADLLIYDINGSASITAKTNIITDKDDWSSPVVYINQANAVIYVGWLGNPSGADTWQSSLTIWSAASVDGGTTWQTSAQFSEAAAGNNKAIWSSHSTPGSSPGKWLLIWYDDTANDLFTNFSNSIITSPIAFDSASNSAYQAASSSYSWSHTCLGNSRYLVVSVAMLSLAQTVSGITYNSVALTFLGAQNSVTGAARIEMWGLIAPATGSNTIAVTLTGSIASEANAVSHVGVNQTSPTEAFNSAQATNVGAADATVNVTTVADYDVVIDQVATDDTAITVGAGQISRNNVTGAGGSGADSTEGPKTPAGSVTMSWTNVAALATWSIGAIALRDTNAVSLAVATARLRSLLGVGL